MTPEELLEIVERGDAPALVARLGDLTDKQRRSLSKPAAALLSEVRNEERDDDFGLQTHRGALARLAVLGVCPWTHARRVRFQELEVFHVETDRSVVSISSRREPAEYHDVALELLAERMPDWADKWLEQQMSEELPRITLKQVQQLVAAGVCKRPTSDAYIRLLSPWQGGMPDFEGDPLVLEQDTWRLFEVDTGAFYNVPSLKRIDHDKWVAGEDPTWNVDSWPRRLCWYAAQGRIDRDRLIDETLRALWRDFKQTILSGLAHFHDLLLTTDNEIAARQEAYTELLRHEYGPCVTIGLTAIERLVKSGEADATLILEAMQDLFRLQSKTQPRKAIRLVEKLVARQPNVVDQAVAGLTSAFQHPSADVHEAAVKLLEKWAAKRADIDWTPIASERDAIAPLHRGRVEELLRNAGQLGDADESTSPIDAGFADRERDVVERIAAVPDKLRNLCGLGEAQVCLTDNVLPSPFPADAMIPVLSGVEPIEPIATVEELLDEVGRAFQAVDSEEQVERIVDGIMRLGGEPLDEFHEHVKTLKAQLVGEPSFGGLTFIGRSTPSVLGLIASWLGVKPGWFEQLKRTPDRDRRHLRPYSIINFYGSLYAGLHTRFKDRQLGPVLSMPTHRGGWIDTGEFVTRLSTVLAGNVYPCRDEVVLGLLRLAPDFRERALELANELAAPLGPIVRHALGGDETPGSSERAPEWLAAGRCRQPLGELPEFTELEIDPSLPDGVTPADYVVESRISQDPDGKPRPRFSVETTPDGKPPDTVFPTVMLAKDRNRDMALDWELSHRITTWPRQPASAFAAAARVFWRNHLNSTSTWDSPAELLRPLLTPDVPWSHIAHVALWMALLSRDESSRAICLDALIEGVQDGRAHPGPLGETLVQLQSGGWLKLNRLADSLAEVARTSPLAELVAAGILDQVIAAWDDIPRDAHHVLALQLELLTTLRGDLSKKARESLTGLKGSSKTAKLARQLVELKSDQQPSTTRVDAILLAIEGRLARAERIERVQR